MTWPLSETIGSLHPLLVFILDSNKHFGHGVRFAPCLPTKFRKECLRHPQVAPYLLLGVTSLSGCEGSHCEVKAKHCWSQCGAGLLRVCL